MLRIAFLCAICLKTSAFQGGSLGNIYGAVNGVTFEAFIANKLLPNLWSGAYVVMDNAKIHLEKRLDY